MKKSIFLITFLLIWCFTSALNAQPTAISPEKRAVIAEIIIITKANENIAETMKKISSQMNEVYPSIIESIVADQKNLTAAQKAELETELTQTGKDFSSRLDEKFYKTINFQEFVEVTFYPLYDKFFSEAELKDLLAFYKTPTGRKLNDLMPQFAAESVRLSNEFLMPKINAIVLQIIKEEAEKVKKNPPPKRKSNK